MAASPVSHTHAKVGGGKLSHEHPGGDDAHKHPKTFGLLPLPGDGPATLMGLAERSALYALAGEEVTFAEGKPLPFLAVGTHTFPQFAHLVKDGKVEVTRERLVQLKEFFDQDARRQNLPVINEDHDTRRAIGWIKSMEFDGPDRLTVVPDWNPVGEALIKNDQYRYVSPELLVNWTDPERGTTYPMISSGLAVTNYPRMKNLGRIAASEDEQCALIACSEISAATPIEARALLLADTYTPAPYQPDADETVKCPGCSKMNDTDARFCDQCGAKLTGMSLAEPPLEARVATLTAQVAQLLGNNATTPPSRPMTDPVTPGVAPMAESETTPTPPTAPAPAEATPPAPAPVAKADEDVRTLLMAEQTRAAEFAAKFAEAETRNLAMAEKLAKMEREDTVKTVRGQFSECVKQGKMTPAEFEVLAPDDDAVIRLSEMPTVLASIQARKPVIEYRERGYTGDDATQDANAEALKFAEELRKNDPKLSTEQAYARAMASHPELLEASLQAHRLA